MLNYTNLRMPLLFLCAAGTAVADYDGGRIANYDGTYEGVIKVTADPLSGGAVDATIADIHTVLDGDITVKTDESKATSSSLTYGHAIRTANAASSITLNTNAPADMLNVTVSGLGGSAVRADAGYVYIDASAYTGEGAGIRFLLNNPNIASEDKKVWETAGFQVYGGHVSVKGETYVETLTERGYGYFISTGSITVNGDTEFLTRGSGSYGIRAMGGTITHNGNLTIKTTATAASGYLYHSYGIHANGGAAITLDGALDISTAGSGAHGVYAASGGSNLVFKQAAKIHTAGGSAYAIYATGAGSNIAFESGDLDLKSSANYAIYAGTGGKITLNGIKLLVPKSTTTADAMRTQGGTIEGVGRYTFEGRMTSAGTNGKIDLKMQNGSIYKGQTVISGTTAKINLSLEDASEWTLVGNSSLSTLDADAGSSLIFTISGAADFTRISKSESFSLDDGAIMKIVLGDYNPVDGDTFNLVSSDLYDISKNIVFDFSEAELADGLFWDIDDFFENGTISVTSIPEPAAIAAAIGLAAATLTWHRRKR